MFSQYRLTSSSSFFSNKLLRIYLRGSKELFEAFSFHLNFVFIQLIKQKSVATWT